ncbi:MAG TPA: gfo/Idh/MocA family oxidoreductase, partial [Planctomycetaceae bacterium]|nr:gfo/Idh/MocA family oxidoreductase [Planctomycetaceae bacterium]
ICHLTNLGYQLGRPLNWDPKKEQFVRDKEANGYLWRKPRDKWDVI